MILNQQRNVRIPVRSLDAFLARACKALRVPPDTLTICLVTKTEMARWNRLYRGKNRPTDVLSFPVEPGKSAHRNRAGGAKHLRRAQRAVPLRRRMQSRGASKDFPAGSRNYLGDIAIAPEVARRNAKEYGRTFGDEMRILILHGILHLMGYDHETDSGQMERRERRLRRALGLMTTEGLDS